MYSVLGTVFDKVPSVAWPLKIPSRGTRFAEAVAAILAVMSVPSGEITLVIA